MQLLFFATYHAGIEDDEVDQKNGHGKPRLRSDSRSQSKDGTAEIERIASVGIRTGDGESFVFTQEAGGIGAKEKTMHAYYTAHQDTPGRGTGKPKNKN